MLGCWLDGSHAGIYSYSELTSTKAPCVQKLEASSLASALNLSLSASSSLGVRGDGDVPFGLWWGRGQVVFLDVVL